MLKMFDWEIPKPAGGWTEARKGGVCVLCGVRTISRKLPFLVWNVCVCGVCVCVCVWCLCVCGVCVQSAESSLFLFGSPGASGDVSCFSDCHPLPRYPLSEARGLSRHILHNHCSAVLSFTPFSPGLPPTVPPLLDDGKKWNREIATVFLQPQKPRVRLHSWDSHFGK